MSDADSAKLPIILWFPRASLRLPNAACQFSADPGCGRQKYFFADLVTSPPHEPVDDCLSCFLDPN